MTEKESEKGLVVVYLSNNPMQAQEIRCLLEGSGLIAFVWDSHVVALNPILGGPLGSVKVLVPKDQVDAARDVFKEAGRLHGDAPLPLTGDSFHPYTDILKRSGRRSAAGANAAGAARTQAACPSCGAKNERDSVFCDQCSRRLRD